MRLRFVPLLAAGVFALSAAATPAQQPAVAPPPKAMAGPFPVVPNADAWDRLPPRKNPQLPEWARVLAGPLPKTTAKMLELDYLQREKNPLGPELSALIRLEVAKALQSKYGVAAAKADLDSVQLPILRKPHGLLGVPDGWSEQTIAVKFAKKLTLEGHAITDREFAEVLKEFGPENTTAIVHTVAYANFHNRILLGLGVKGESPPAPPVDVKFDLEAAKVTAPPRPPWDDLKATTASGPSVRVAWSKADADQLNRTLEKQKERTLRLPLPDESRLKALPPREQDAAKRILWNTVSSGYQPEMTRAWFAVLSAFYEEAKPDRVFTNSAFWVVTRTNDCFY
jgi:alkylhydroperoxidase family enzyme